MTAIIIIYNAGVCIYERESDSLTRTARSSVLASAEALYAIVVFYRIYPRRAKPKQATFFRFESDYIYNSCHKDQPGPFVQCDSVQLDAISYNIIRQLYEAHLGPTSILA